MQRSIKAALLSGLVFPGAGQLFLGRYLRGCLFLVPALVAAVYFTSTVLEPIMAIAQQVQSGTLPFDPLVIEARLQQNGAAASPLVNAAALVMLVSWIGATVDAWFAGRAPVGHGKISSKISSSSSSSKAL